MGIANVLLLYQHLNEIYRKQFSHGALLDDEAMYVVNFNSQALSIKQDLFLCNPEDNTPQLKLLKKYIEENLSLYDDLGDELLSDLACRSYDNMDARAIKLSIENQKNVVNEIGKEYNLCNNDLDMASEEDPRWNEHRRLKNEYEKEKEKLENLYSQEKQHIRLISDYSDAFIAIKRLDETLLSIIGEYIPMDKAQEILPETCSGFEHKDSELPDGTENSSRFEGRGKTKKTRVPLSLLSFVNEKKADPKTFCLRLKELLEPSKDEKTGECRMNYDKMELVLRAAKEQRLLIKQIPYSVMKNEFDGLPSKSYYNKLMKDDPKYERISQKNLEEYDFKLNEDKNNTSCE